MSRRGNLSPRARCRADGSRCQTAGYDGGITTRAWWMLRHPAPGEAVSRQVGERSRDAHLPLFCRFFFTPGPGLYLEWMKKYKTPEKIEAEVRANFVVGGHKAYAVTRLMKKAQFIFLSGLDPGLARALLFTPAKDMNEALNMAFAKLGPKPRILLMPQGSLTVPIPK